LSQKQYLKILKPKTRPVQIEPWFYRYLTAGQLRVLSAIIAHADYATRSKDSFASNKTIAFYGGFGLINSDTKDFAHFQTLTSDEKIAYKKKKMRNAIQTVKNIKRQLEELGVITREIVNTKSYAVVDLEWGKERYLKEFDEYFNDSEENAEPTENEINKELENIAKLANEGNISKDSLAKQLESITSKLRTDVNVKDASDDEVEIPEEDIDKVVEHVMSSEPYCSKVESGIIQNAHAYKNKVKKDIQSRKFKGVNSFYSDLLAQEKVNLLGSVYDRLDHILKKDDKTLALSNVIPKNQIFYAQYKNILNNSDEYIPISPSFLKESFINELRSRELNYEDYTLATREYLENYEKNYEKSLKLEVKNE